MKTESAELLTTGEKQTLLMRVLALLMDCCVTLGKPLCLSRPESSLEWDRIDY